MLKRERVLQGMVEVRLNKKLFDGTPDGISIDNVVKVVIEKDVTPEMLLHGLNRINCLQIECNEEQETALCAIGVPLKLMRDMPEIEGDKSDLAVPGEGASCEINAESYVL